MASFRSISSNCLKNQVLVSVQVSEKQAETQVERLQKMVDEVLPGVNDGSGDGQKDILMDEEISVINKVCMVKNAKFRSWSR